MVEYEKSGAPFIVIFGSGRSGTTLIREILNQHPLINVLPETGFYDRLWSARHLLGTPRCRDGLVRWLYYLLFQSYDPAMSVYRPYLADVIEEFTITPPSDENELFVRFAQILGEKKGKIIHGEKTPRHLLYWRKILEEVPNSRVILMVRDPRAVVASMLKRGDLASEAWRAAVEWRLFAETTKQIMSSNAGRVKVVLYEELIRDSVSTINSICEFLDIEYHPVMERGGVSNSSYNAGAPGIFSDSLDRWKIELSKTEIQVVERISGPELAKYGYEESTKNNNFSLTFKEAILYKKMQLEVILGNLGVRPNRAYLHNLRCRMARGGWS